MLNFPMPLKVCIQVNLSSCEVNVITVLTVTQLYVLTVTQLYVSVDAPSKDALKKVDRPLFRDFWPRFIQSLQALRDKVQTVTICVNVSRSNVPFTVSLW